MRDPTGRSERGFALVAALVALTGLTVLAAGGWYLSDAERRTSHAFERSVDAFYVAQAGLSRYLDEHRGVPSSARSYTFAAGKARVEARPLVFDGDGREVYLVTSDGRVDGDDGGGTRRVSRLAVLDPFVANLPGTLISGAGVIKNGSSGTIDGDDASRSDDCPVGGTPTGPGLYVKDDGQPGYSSVPSTVPEGDPPVQELSDPLAGLGLDWQSVVDGAALSPDYTVPDGRWPNFSSLDSDAYPVIYADEPGSYAVSGDDDGRGLLVVRGDLEMNGSFEWDGLILVGGAITSDGRQHISGSVVTGLNATLDPPETVDDTDLGNGNMTFGFDACEIWKASRAAGVLVERASTWSEEF